MEPLWISLFAALISALIASLIGTLAARVRFSAKPGLRWVLDILFLLPLLGPAALVPYGMRALHIPIFSYSLIVVSDLMAMDIVAAAPFLYFCTFMGFRKCNLEWIDAAKLQGLGSWGIFRHVQLAAGWPWFVAGLFLGFLRAFGESSITFLLLNVG